MAAAVQPATTLKRVAPSLFAWSSHHAQWHVDFSSHALTTPEGVALIDPVRLTEPALKKLEALGDPIGVFLTNGNHDRSADWFRKRYGIQVYAHEKAKTGAEIPLDVLVLDGEQLPGGLSVIEVPGSAAGEVVFHTAQEKGIVFIGDAILHQPDGLSMLPPAYCEDQQQAIRSLRRLLELRFAIAAFSHGHAIIGDAQARISAFIRKQKKKNA
jgi:glyoxylase-like metal-dependent hydrolase (beta-lactamase superfamily II)